MLFQRKNNTYYIIPSERLSLFKRTELQSNRFGQMMNTESHQGLKLGRKRFNKSSMHAVRYATGNKQDNGLHSSGMYGMDVAFVSTKRPFLRNGMTQYNTFDIIPEKFTHPLVYLFTRLLVYSFTCLLVYSFTSCREDELTVPVEQDILPIQPNPDREPRGMYLLNEGNMGSNKASIDFVDFRNAVYVRNLYAERNPNVIMELGDVGNDIQIYGKKLYAVINCSHKVEVMNAYTCERIGQVDIPNCRYIRFDKGNAYVSSYVGPVATDPHAQQGVVFRIDTASLEITGTVTVGYQPDELEIRNDYLYVVNSGGYRAPDYDYTISVVDLDKMKQTEKIPVGINLNRIKKDKYGKLWVSSGGNHRDIPPKMYVLEAKSKDANRMIVTDTLDISCSDMCIQGDSLYFYNSTTGQSNETVSYGIIDVRTKQLIFRNFIMDGTESEIKLPSGIQIDPNNGDIYITDAKNYVSSGMLYCYGKDGKRKWSVRTGDIPAHMVFLY